MGQLRNWGAEDNDLLGHIGPCTAKVQIYCVQYRWALTVEPRLSCTVQLDHACLVRGGPAKLHDCGSTPFGPPIPTVQARLLSTVGQLTDLRSLSLEYQCHCHQHEDGVPAHDLSSLRHLSTLTRMASLDLNLYHYKTEAVIPFEDDDEAYAHWQRLWPEQRAALTGALHLMPHLATFSSRTLHMCASDFAPLTCLRRVSLGGLLAEGHHNPSAQPLSACAYRSPPSAPQQQQQQQQGHGMQLILEKMAPVGVLASVRQHWPALRSSHNRTGGWWTWYLAPWTCPRTPTRCCPTPRRRCCGR